MMTVESIVKLMRPGDCVTIFFDGENYDEYVVGSTFLMAIGDCVVEQIHCYTTDRHREPGLQLNIKMNHEPVKATE